MGKMVFVLCLIAQLCLTFSDPVDCSPLGSSVHEDCPGKNTGVGCHALLQGIFPTQESNPGLPHCRLDSLPSELPGKPKNTGVGSLAIEPGSPALQADSLLAELPGKPKMLFRIKLQCIKHDCIKT